MRAFEASKQIRRTFRAPLLIASAVCFAAILSAVSEARAQEAALEGRRVVSIQVLNEEGQAVNNKVPPLPLEIGKPFDFVAERASLRALYALGDYADLRVTTESEANGLVVRFIAQRNYYNNVVRVSGLKEPPSEPAAVAAMQLSLGEPFRESALKDAVERLEKTLHENGLYLAKVQPTLVPHDDTRQMDILVAVDPGPRALVGDIVLQNHTPFSDRILLKRSKISPKTTVTTAGIARNTQDLRKFLVNQGYLGASAEITPGTYNSATNRVPITYAVTTGPRVRISIDGAHISKGQQRKLLPMYAEGAVDDDLLQEGRRNMRDYLQGEGYFDADVQVNSQETHSGNERDIVYEVQRGDRFRVAGLAFDGNRYFDRDLLVRRLQIQAASFASKGRFSQQLLRNDEDSIRSLYLTNGFRDAMVTSTVEDNYSGKKNNLFVSFHITEGLQTRIASVKIEGNQALSTETLLSVMGSTPGQDYSESGVARDRNNILAMYYNEGFPEAHSNEDVTPGPVPNQVNVAFHITEGTQIEVSKVLLTGYQYTRPGIIRRQVNVQAGGPLREGDVVDSERRLYSLAIFNRVQIAPQNPDGSDPDKSVVVDTEEGQRYTIGYGFGFEVQRLAGSGNNPNGTTLGASPRGIFEIARSNMFGRAQTLSFRARISTLQYRSALSYSADNFLSKQSLSLQLTGFAEKTQDIDTFTSTRYEGALQLVDKRSSSSSLLFRYFYRRVEAAELKVDPEEIPLLSQPTLVSGFGATYARDRRDNPSDATHGTFNTADVSVASTALGSSASFFRGFFQNSSFTSFGKAFVFARSLRFGTEIPLGNTSEAAVTECATSQPTTSLEIIPLPERFFAGGGTSIRGFSLNQAGPRDPCTGFPVGGLALLALNQELRFPMNLPFVGNKLGGTVFYDGGNVYTDTQHITLRWKPTSPSDLNYFSNTIGFGVRYPTPVGPVRVDFGYQLNPAQYQVLNTTTNTTQLDRLPHFQFFFNIGPIF